VAVRIVDLLSSTLVSTLAFVSMATAQEVMIMDRAKLGDGPALQAGTYRIEVVKNDAFTEVLFYKQDELWLRVPVTLEPEPKKIQHTEVYYQEIDSGRVITKIRLRGSKDTLVFSPSPPPKAQ